MKRFLSALTVCCVVLFGSLQHASATDICSMKQNLAVDPAKPLRSMTNGWLQWLNKSYMFTCSGTSAHLSCAHGSEVYTFDYSCDSSHCYVEAWQGSTWRNEAVATPSGGNVWAWKWDGWKDGYVQMICTPDPGVVGGCLWSYGTCD